MREKPQKASEELRVLVIGSGGREHALVWKIAESPLVSEVIAAPGSDAIGEIAKIVPEVGVNDADAILALAEREKVGLVVVGPEDPLADGLSDRLREAGFDVFGPSAAAARLEGSKGFARAFMARHRIPHPAFECFTDLEAARQHVRERGGACVVKADGLCAGKGVFVCDTPEQALAALDEIMAEGRFGEAGAEVLIEDVLRGEEASYYAITDGDRVVTLAAAQDHKRLLDGDKGENTGGMGAYAPAPLVDPGVEKLILEEVVYPTLRGMRAEGTPYTGVLYVGLMIDGGRPSVVEFNVRFGDPETQPLMLALDGDLVPTLLRSARGRLEGDAHLSQSHASVCVVLASGGYPRSYETGLAIEGLDAAGEDDDVVVFHAGTKRGEDGTWRTAGGRVLGVTARGATIREARDRAYRAADAIDFPGCHRRSDIAHRAL